MYTFQGSAELMADGHDSVQSTASHCQGLASSGPLGDGRCSNIGQPCIFQTLIHSLSILLGIKDLQFVSGLPIVVLTPFFPGSLPYF